MKQIPRLVAVVGASGVLVVSGVGVTMAATGSFSAPVPTATSASKRESRTPETTPPSAADGSISGDGTLPSGLDAFNLDWETVRASGFVGVEISITPGHVSFIAQTVKNGDGALNVDVSVNGQVVSTGSVPCSATRIGQLCNSAQGWPLDAEHFFCAAGGDTVTVHAYGFGLDETKSASIPRDMENCPEPEPEPVPEPDPQPSVTDEPVVSNEPTASPTPNAG